MPSNYFTLSEGMQKVVLSCAAVGAYVILRRANEYVHFENLIFGKGKK